MGCCGASRSIGTSSSILNAPLNFKLPQVESFTSTNKELNTIFQRASCIMESFENIREKVVDNLDILMYKTAACVYHNPSIVHCLNNIWYKISCDLNGKIEEVNLKYIEDSPFMNMNLKNVHSDTIKLVELLFDYINSLRSIKTTLKQMENSLAELIYLLNENSFPQSNQICEFNKNKIHQAIKMFPELHNFYNLVLQKYRYEIYLFIMKKEEYIYKINLLGKEAYSLGYNDIYQVSFLYKKFMKVRPEYFKEESMYPNENIGKKKFLDFINSKKRAKKDYNFVLSDDELWDISENKPKS